MIPSLRRSPALETVQHHESTAEFRAILVAVRQERLHILELGKGVHIHFGDIATMEPNEANLSPNSVSMSNLGDHSIKDGAVEAHGIRVPLSPDKLKVVLEYLKKNYAIPQAQVLMK